MNVINESVSIKRKSKTPHWGACGPTAIPITIKNGMLDKPSLLARAMANAINPNAKPISKIMLSTNCPHTSFNKKSFQGLDCASVARGNKRCAFVQDGVGLRVSALRVIGFDERDDGRPRPSANFEVSYCSANTRRPSFNGEPLQHEIA